MTFKKTDFNRQKVLIVGGDSFLGRHFQAQLQAWPEFEVDVTTRRSETRAAIYFDILKDDRPFAFSSQRYDFVIWLASNKDVKWCESHFEEARLLNVVAFQKHYSFFKSVSSKTSFIFFSSDYVFDGKKGSYGPTDQTCPDTVYGQLKCEVEEFLIQQKSNDFILRSSAVLGTGSVFFDWMLNELVSKKEVLFFENSFFTPTSVTYLAEVLKSLMLAGHSGHSLEIRHACGDLRFSRVELARKLQNECSTFRNVKIVGTQAEAQFAKDLSLKSSEGIFRRHQFRDILNEVKKVIDKPT